MARLFTIIISFLTVLILGSSAYSGTLGVESLRGLNGVCVSNSLSTSPEIQMKGLLTEDQLKTNIELKLRMAGIRLFSEKELATIPGFPNFIMEVVVLPIPFGFVYSIQCFLQQFTYLGRQPSITQMAITWRGPSLTGTSDHIGTVRDQLKNLMDMFINDYLSANPKGGI
jgi:hypothetical protein